MSRHKAVRAGAPPRVHAEFRASAPGERDSNALNRGALDLTARLIARQANTPDFEKSPLFATMDFTVSIKKYEHPDSSKYWMGERQKQNELVGI